MNAASLTCHAPTALSAISFDETDFLGGNKGKTLQTNMRFIVRPGIGLLKTAFRALSATVPELAARLGSRVLATPPRHQTPAWEQQLKSTAQRCEIRVGKRIIQVYEWGAGPVVLLSHCWGGRATQLGHLVRPLVARGYRVVAFDGPGHGESGIGQTDMIEFPAVIRAVADHAGPLHALVGHSFGAAMSALALHNEDCVTNKLVLIGSFTDCEWFTQAFADYFHIPANVLRLMRERFSARHRREIDWQRLSVRCALQANVLPTLIIHDVYDREIPFDHALQLKAAAPRAELFATKGLGHRRILRDGKVMERIVKFID